MKQKLSRAAYKEVAAMLLDRIRGGDWTRGAALPSCQTLATQYNVAAGTVHQAISSLAAEGIVRSVPGRGTFVTGEGIESDAQGASTMRIAIVAGISQGDSPTGIDRGTSTVITAIERICGSIGGSAMFYSRQMADLDWEPFATSVKRIDWDRVDGAVLVGIGKNLETPDDFLRVEREARKPIVCLTAGELPGIIPHVMYDNTFAGYQAGQHLIEKGFNRIVFLNPFRSSWARVRAFGVKQALTDAELPGDAMTFHPGWDSVPSVDDLGRVTFSMTMNAASEAAERLLDQSGGPLAIVASNDASAIGYIEAAAKRGLHPGVDYAILGFDNRDEARNASLTSMQPPWEAMSEEAIRLLSAMTRGQHVATQVRIRPHLVPRASTDITYSSLRPLIGTKSLNTNAR